MILAKFIDVVQFLRLRGYSVNVTLYDDFKFADISGNNIRGGMATQSNMTHPYLSKRICANHIDCFYKWSKCPMVIKFPVDSDFLLDNLKLLGSKEGYEISNTYSYLNYNPFPFDINEEN